MSKSEEARITKNRANLKPLSIDKLKQLQEIELDAIARFSGNVEELESAIGFLRLGLQIGWRPLAVMHSKRTFKKYEAILGIDARDIFQEETPASERSKGYAFTKKLTNFWKAVSGDIKVEDRGVINSH